MNSRKSTQQEEKREGIKKKDRSELEKEEEKEVKLANSTAPVDWAMSFCGQAGYLRGNYCHPPAKQVKSKND